MEDTKGRIEVDRSTLEEIERRVLRVSVSLNRIKSAVERGDLERFRNLWEEAREANSTNRRALHAVGARDSVLVDRGLTEYPPDDDDLIDTDALDLATLPPPSGIDVPE